MRIWSVGQQIPYSFDQVSTVFWERYPNSKAKHIHSEDLLEVCVIGDQIRTKKLIMKKTDSFLSKVPKWMSRLTNASLIPTVEESIYDRSKRTLVTYTRNIANMSLCIIHERCVYKSNINDGKETKITDIQRSGYVNAYFKRFNSLIERVLMANFKKSMDKAVKGYNEKLVERYGKIERYERSSNRFYRRSKSPEIEIP